MDERRGGNALPPYLADLIKHPPSDWDDPRRRVVATLMEQSGILPQMVSRNPELSQRVTDFLLGERGILVVGGESGMGKSLIGADLRKMHEDLQRILPEGLRTKLVVITWDRTHKVFFDQVSTEAGWSIPLPKGETHSEGRKIVSPVLGDQIRYAKKYLGPDTIILLEAPLIDNRGETIFRELGEFRGETQTLIMHSPKTRYETLQKAERLMETSGQRDSMVAIREKLLYRIMGGAYKSLSDGEQDEVIRRWWIQKLREWGGMVVDWDPDDNREGFNNSVEGFKQAGIRTDLLSPRALSYFTRSQIDSVFLTIRDMDEFIRLITS